MRILSVFLSLLFSLAAGGTALAVPCAAQMTAPAADATTPSGDISLIPCAAASAASASNLTHAPVTIGDLVPKNQSLGNLFCNPNCAYMLAVPTDPQSPIIPVRCGSQSQQGLAGPFVTSGGCSTVRLSVTGAPASLTHAPNAGDAMPQRSGTGPSTVKPGTGSPRSAYPGTARPNLPANHHIPLQKATKHGHDPVPTDPRIP